MAMADFGVHPEGREILRREGAIRPLVLLLAEGLESPAAEQAAKALMTLAASDINKVAVVTAVVKVTASKVLPSQQLLAAWPCSHCTC